MSISLVTDPTESGFNSFVSIEEADEYFSGVYFGSSQSWDEFDEDSKARLLITASRALSTLSWTGVPTTSMAFPRAYPNRLSVQSSVPAFVKSLVCEWAKWLWQEGPASESGSEDPIKSASIGELSVTYETSASVAAKSGLPASITALLQPLAPYYLTINQRARSLSMRY